MRDVVKAVMRATGAKVKVHWGSMQARVWDTETWLADPSKVRRVMKWAPKIGLAEGIEGTTEWFRRNMTAVQ
jgi:nucleoside-diphosphate-sugar epimerase